MGGDWKRASCHGNIILIGVFLEEPTKFPWSVLYTGHDSSIYIT